MKRSIAYVMTAAAIAAAVAVPSSAQAETCVPVPVGSSGFTLEAAGQRVRIPAIASAAVCYEIPGLPGIPWVRTEYGGASVVITSGSGAAGSFAVRYTADGATNEVRVPVPGTGGGSEICLFGVGSPYARPDCLVKLHADQLVPTPLPTVPPVPTVEPPPTLPPIGEPPGDVCVNERICVLDLAQRVFDAIQRILDDPCTIDPKC